ncbi:hypothetical protein ADL34_21310 [Streptomyces sp. NRRL WC-3605]|nr:hypothetical protein ADL34_21310 [Streptomyces sp. NRRL WC-3605]
MEHAGDQVRREGGFGGAELPDRRAERLHLAQVELHQALLAGGRKPRVHERGGGPVGAFGAEAQALPEERLDPFQRALRVGQGAPERLVGAPERLLGDGGQQGRR